MSASLALPAHGWGRTGHAAIAYIADAQLSPEVRRRVMQLLATDRSGLADPKDLGDEANWADRYRDAGRRGDAYRITQPWHFVNLDRYRPDLRAACLGRVETDAAASESGESAHACIVDALIALRGELADTSAPAHRRLRALQFVVHLIGDIHQPMHTISNRDRGGNETIVVMRHGRADTLHHLWDTALVERLGDVLDTGHDARDRPANAHDWQADARAIADALLIRLERGGAAPFEAPLPDAACIARTAFDPEAWAWASFGIARTLAYRPLRASRHGARYRLGKRDELRAVEAVAQQLTCAGLRLARVLEDAFGTDDPAS
ncbi:S1/P1 nuclease [Pararobbsia silviterrae]|uniref:S1/P1 nuclease n=1 Tax=Pararobbsia silviterrae TaxID=1792498 RepID=UPI0013146752|nr:S1/P1 nuclease [Pararobbsia silviterrae]